MRNGFIFKHDRCVGCNACRAACSLENRGTVHLRNIFTYNIGSENFSPVINLSMACNHCESAICMKGCPASVFSRDKATGAIILNEKKCIGCKYCQWNCPYDAPKFDILKKTIAKCNLCYTGLKEGRKPACSTACPTGALSFGELNVSESKTAFRWFPDKQLVPALQFIANGNDVPLKIIPLNKGKQVVKQNRNDKNIKGELSLVIFSFLTTLSVALVHSSFIKGIYPEKYTFLVMLATAGTCSLFHLGKKLRSWRALTNLKTSPLSREIAAFILYSALSTSALFLQLPSLLISSALTGLLLLLLLDSVYIYADKSRSVVLHSGQTFLSALTIASFLSGSILPFAFTFIIKLGLTAYRHIFIKPDFSESSVRFLRIALLVVPGLSLLLLNSNPGISIIFIFLTGEFIDRILFYYDFNPLNINSLIKEHLKRERDEKEKY